MTADWLFVVSICLPLSLYFSNPIVYERTEKLFLTAAARAKVEKKGTQQRSIVCGLLSPFIAVIGITVIFLLHLQTPVNSDRAVDSKQRATSAWAKGSPMAKMMPTACCDWPVEDRYLPQRFNLSSYTDLDSRGHLDISLTPTLFCEFDFQIPHDERIG